MKRTIPCLLAVLGAFIPVCVSAQAVFINFDDLPPTADNAVPNSSSSWLYTSGTTNPDSSYPMTAYRSSGWRAVQAYPNAPGVYDFFYLYINGYNSPNMGYEEYGYFSIDSMRAVRGRSLKLTITGGKNQESCAGTSGEECTTSFGRRVGSKEDYLNYLAQGIDPVERTHIVGAPYIYFLNTSPGSTPAAMPQANGANRLSFYLYVPSFVRNGQGGYSHPVELTLDAGPYNDVGGHWYNHFYTQGGGWTHYLVDGHPQHNNAFSNPGLYPYPSSSVRSMGYDYFRTMHRWYIAASPYSPGWGGVPPYSLWLDEIEFINDREPQNDETIASPSLLYKADSKTFEIGFNDKYKNNEHSYSSYEVRYSFSPITNANWLQATPAHVLPDERFSIDERADGKFAKWWPYYQSVWAAFRLASPADDVRLAPGTRLFIAIKDISQENGDGVQPVRNCGFGGWTICGRDYGNHGATFDYAGDRPALPLIKRIDFVLGPAPGVPPAPPAALRIRP